MFGNQWYKKESPLPTLIGLGGGALSWVYSGVKKIYDEYFYAHLGDSFNNHLSCVTTDNENSVYGHWLNYTAFDSYASGAGNTLSKWKGDGTYEWSRWILDSSKTYAGKADIQISTKKYLATDSSNNVYMVGGYAPSGSVIQDAWIGKFNSDGEFIWQRKLSTGSDIYDVFRAVTVDSSGNVYVTGGSGIDSSESSTYQTTTCKFNSSGTVQWSRKWNTVAPPSGSNHQAGDGIVVDSNGNVYVLARWTFDNPDGGFTLIKYNNSGTQQFSIDYTGFAGDASSITAAKGLVIDSSDNIFVCGNLSMETANERDAFMIKINSSGVPQWWRYAGWRGTTASMDISWDCAIDSDDNVYTCGETNINATYNNEMLIKWNNNNGTVDWANFIGGSTSNSYNNNYTQGQSITIDKSDRIVTSGVTYLFDNSGTNASGYVTRISNDNTARGWYDVNGTNVYYVNINKEPFSGDFRSGATESVTDADASISSGVLAWTDNSTTSFTIVTASGVSDEHVTIIPKPDPLANESIFSTAGTYSWVAPAEAASYGVSVVCIGGGASADNGLGDGSGGGGGLGYKNNVPVISGQSYTVVVGAKGGTSPQSYEVVYGSPGGDSYFIDATTVKGEGGSAPADGRSGGAWVGDGGGGGGNGHARPSSGQGALEGSGGAGAGGYSGSGGNGGHGSPGSGTQGTGGGGGGGSGGETSPIMGGGGGGGGGIYGGGDSGVSNPLTGGGGQGGSGGIDGYSRNWVPTRSGGEGGNFGGGGGSGTMDPTTGPPMIAGSGGAGGVGAVRIIWGPGRAFPKTKTGEGGCPSPGP